MKTWWVLLLGAVLVTASCSKKTPPSAGEPVEASSGDDAAAAEQGEAPAATPDVDAGAAAPPFAAAPAFDGEIAPLDTSSHEAAPHYRTRLEEGIAKGPNFAGAYRVVTAGCGTSCMALFVVSLETGAVLDQITSCGAYDADVSSRLLVVNPPLDDVDYPEGCELERYELVDGALVELAADDPRLTK